MPTRLLAGRLVVSSHLGVPARVALALFLSACSGGSIAVDASAGLDSGAVDAGAPIDTGLPIDAGADDGGADDAGADDAGADDAGADDAGADDAGADDAGADDAGADDAGADDAGLEPDASIDSDGGGDAGSDDGGVPSGYPLDYALPAGTTMVSVTRLGDDAFVLASIRNSDAATPPGEALALQRIARVGHALVPGPEQVLAETTIDPGIDNPIHLMGAIGDAHFFVVVSPPSGPLRLRFFAHRGGAFVDLGTTELGMDAFLSGHPVDARRHILGFRSGNSGEPFRYRLLLRDGDTLTLGPALERPAGSAFPGLSPDESQTDPALFRVGPSTFVEARPGYVHVPGQLATWTLTVGADDTLVASSPTVHATVPRTMSPEVAADGRGGALVIYFPYASGGMQWYQALYDHSTRALGPERALVHEGTTSIRAHQGESTDRHLGGAYYLRPAGGPGIVPLLRVDATTGTTTTVADVPSLWHCSRAPQLIRAGTIAALTACDRVVFLDLLPSCGDGVVAAPEACDDGGSSDGDGCSAGCTIEPGPG